MAGRRGAARRPRFPSPGALASRHPTVPSVACPLSAATTATNPAPCLSYPSARPQTLSGIALLPMLVSQWLKTMYECETHTELPFSQRAAKSLPGRRTAGDTNRGLVAQGDGWNHVRLVKIQGENISPSAHSQVSNELVLVLRNPHSHTRDCGLWGSWLRERFPRPRRQWWGRGGRRAKPPGRVWERRSLPLANGSASAPPQP